MRNTETDFYGRQGDEKILYVVRPHYLSSFMKLIKVYFVALVVFLAFVLVGAQIVSVSSLFKFLGIALGTLIAVIGTKIIYPNKTRMSRPLLKAIL